MVTMMVMVMMMMVTTIKQQQQFSDSTSYRKCDDVKDVQCQMSTQYEMFQMSASSPHTGSSPSPRKSCPTPNSQILVFMNSFTMPNFLTTI